MRNVFCASKSLSIGMISMAATVGVASLTRAAVVSVQFTPGTPVTGTAGVVPAAGFNIDSMSATYFGAPETTGLSNLLDSTGANSGISETKVDDGTYHAGAPTMFSNPEDNNLFSGGVLEIYGGATSSLTLTGLDATMSYDVYVYVKDPNGGNAGTVNITDNRDSQSYFGNVLGGASFTSYVQGTGATAATATDNTNYFKLTGITGFTSLTTDLTGGGGYDLVGFQLVSSPGGGGSGTPEPASLGLLGLGVAALAKRRRRA